MNDRRQLALGMSQPRQQPFDPPEREIDQQRVQPLQIGQQLVEWGHRSALPGAGAAKKCPSARILLALIADLRASATVIFSTHVLADVERICDRVGIMDHGRLVTEGPLDELLGPLRAADLPDRAGARPGRGRRRARRRPLRATPWVDGVVAGDRRRAAPRVGHATRRAASAGLLPLVVAAGVRLDAFERARPTLEDVFLRLVGRETDDGAAA